MHFTEPILHVDMDSFFVEVERLDDPRLVGKPVAVGGTGGRGVVASASYEARQFGVRSAMPVGEARRRCRELIVVDPTHGRYGEISHDVFGIMRSFTPLVEGISIDEAFLDVSGLRLHYPSSEAVGKDIRSEIRRQIGIPASVGIAATKFIAKIASGHAKPDGLLRIPSGTELAFLHPLDVGELWGVGAATGETLRDLGIRTVGDLAQTPADVLERRIGTAAATHLLALARAEDPRPVEGTESARSISSEATFAKDIKDRDLVERETLRLCDQVSARLGKAGVAGHTVTLKVRFSDFVTITRSSRLARPIANTSEIWEVTRGLISRAEIDDREVRLLGVGMSDLADVEEARQLVLGRERQDAAADAVTAVRDRYGTGSVVPARIVRPPERGDR
ncbi:MAG: DNA polymerase IV [Actinomycetota bacterium]